MLRGLSFFSFFFFFNDTATTEIYTLSLHDALPISGLADGRLLDELDGLGDPVDRRGGASHGNDGRRQRVHLQARSEEHTSELQSPCKLVCRLLLEKKKKQHHMIALSVDSIQLSILSAITSFFYAERSFFFLFFFFF